MFVSDHLVFVELHKTGGSHIGKWLQELLGGQQIGKHNRIPAHLRKRFVVGSIRNPWDWYVSLWAYGCAGEGSVRRQVSRRLNLAYVWRQLGREMGRTSPSFLEAFVQVAHDAMKPVGTWEAVYRDPFDAGAFRAWLQLIHDPERSFDVGEGYGFSPVSRWAGLLTYRYLKLFTSLDDTLYSDDAPASVEEAKAIWERQRIVDFVVRNEHLEVDLLAALERAELQLANDDRERLLSGREERTNASKRLPVHHYYDNASSDLIARREALILANHGYEPHKKRR